MCAFVCCCSACDPVSEFEVCRVRFARVSCPRLRFWNHPPMVLLLLVRYCVYRGLFHTDVSIEGSVFSSASQCCAVAHRLGTVRRYGLVPIEDPVSIAAAAAENTLPWFVGRTDGRRCPSASGHVVGASRKRSGQRTSTTLPSVMLQLAAYIICHRLQAAGPRLRPE